MSEGTVRPMHKKKKYIHIVALTVAFILLVNNGWLLASGWASQRESVLSIEASVDQEQTWIIKWKTSPPESFHRESETVKKLEDLNIWVARPKAGVDLADWLQKWSDHSNVQYLQRNHRVKIENTPNDPLLSSQPHLNMIGAKEAWRTAREQTSITIALIDTGVDLDHPDLKDNLVKGINLLNRNAPPQDDNGHGTSVAGVIAAKGNNKLGVSGILWNAKIMPIKAMESNGYGNELELGEGIRYAVDHGAKIVVIPLGLYKYSPFLEEIVLYAENKGVLLVAASGNDGQAVKYPAAYPTVLAVGGIHADKSIVAASNYGQELDVLAPWRVYTTAKGGGYAYDQGTSMATPQVAAAAALIWSRHPELKPHQVRNIIRQTAEPIGGQRWSERTGYGLLRIDRAVAVNKVEDIYEPNNERNSARRLPLGKMSSAILSSSSDRDWFVITSDYDGEVRFRVQTDRANDRRHLKLVYFESAHSKGTTYSDLSKEIRVPVKAGERSYFYIGAKSGAEIRSLHYRITPMFQIAPDSFEDNDRQYRAYLLPTRNQTVTGNFHQLNDVDWFVLHVEQEGVLRVRMSTDTYRIDPELWIQRAGEDPRIFDDGGWGQTEYSGNIDVFPGKYYIRASNMIAQEAYPVPGEYTLTIQLEYKYGDPNEPNNRSYQATSMVQGNKYVGVIHPDDDADWFSFRIPGERYVTVKVDHIPSNRIMSLSLYDSKQNQLLIHLNNPGQTTLKAEKLLQAGQYLVRLSANSGFQHQQYEISYDAEPLVGGFRDIAQHWAKGPIVDMAEKRIVSGYSDYTFRPNQPITRAEAAAILSSAFELKPEREYAAFKDIHERHWAYYAIVAVTRARVANGYPDGTFAPSRPLTRMEMTVMMANAAGLKGVRGTSSPFSDIPLGHWGLPLVVEMVQKGWASGYEDGTFRPQQTATRAEFVAMLHRLIQR
mgnify:CR=1 FL=1